MNVRFIEVGPRDGLQNEPDHLDWQIKLKFIELLLEAGHRSLEAGSFVNPKAVPQMADTGKIYEKLINNDNFAQSQVIALVPNIKGYELAKQSHCKDIAVFTAASETFNQKNIRASIAESIENMRAFVPDALSAGAFVRGYVSTAFGCPYEGDIAPKKVAEVTEKLLELGAHEIVVSDTIGIADPKQVKSLAKDLFSILNDKTFALHVHDTRGLGTVNVYAALEAGVRIFDGSAVGLGGCPFAPGATGNVASEELLLLFSRLGMDTGIDLKKHVIATRYIQKELNRKLPSKLLHVD